MLPRRQKQGYAGRIVRNLARGGSAPTEPPTVARSRRVRAGTRPTPTRQPGVELLVPGATYRFQFHKQFTFSDAEALVDYLKALGVTHCYASPIFAARKDSTHGYDVCSFERVSEAAGGEAAFLKLARRLRHAGMSLVLDIVPNHMAADCANEWWFDVLDKGLHSKYARWFDIEWDSSIPGLHHKVLLPVLEDHLDKVIHDGKITLAWENGRYFIQYCERRFPVSPESSNQLDQDAAALGQSHSGVGARVSERARTAPEKLLHKYNAKDHRDLLRALLRQQHYLLAFWRDASEKLNYRRFFDVSDLVSVRVESPQVFESIHRVALRLINEGLVTGLRVDHPDGLWEPTTYFQRLQEAARKASGKRDDFYIVAEKILTRNEPLPRAWPVAGTTGYEYLNRLNGVFVDCNAEPAFTRFYEDFTGNSADFEDVTRNGKRLVLSTSFRIGVTSLSRKLHPLLGNDQFTFEAVWQAVRAVIINFPVYRSYICEHTAKPTAFEAECINHAIAETLARRPDIDGEILRLLRSILLLSHPKSRLPKFRHFVMKFQQLTGPAMAKGLEDTAFYNYTRLVSLNEVGGDPGTFGTPLEKFHEHNERMACDWPHTLCATATHDTKRGEDARARINVLSEFPKEWRDAVLRWTKMNADKRTRLRSGWAPVAGDEYLFYQTLIGVWPFGKKYSVFSRQYSEPDLTSLCERVMAYMLKAIKEAKRHTSWLEPNEDYEAAVKNFVSAALDEDISARFLHDFEAFHKDIAHFGWLNSLSQVLLKTMSPGVPDIYQGCELWDFSMVDPDNRRPVDFKLRQQILNHLRNPPTESHPSHFLPDLLKKPESGAIKLYVLSRALSFRRQHREFFDTGTYTPLQIQGTHADHVVAFARRLGKQQIIAIAPRLIAGLCKKKRILPLGESVWADTALKLDTKKAKRFSNIMTGESFEARAGTVRLADVLAHFPVAILSPADYSV